MRVLLTQVGTIPTSRLHILLLPSYYTEAERKLPTRLCVLLGKNF